MQAFVTEKDNRSSSAIDASATCSKIPLVGRHALARIRLTCQRRRVEVVSARLLLSLRMSALMPYAQDMILTGFQVLEWQRPRQPQPQGPRRLPNKWLIRVRRAMSSDPSRQDAPADVRGHVGYHALQRSKHLARRWLAAICILHGRWNRLWTACKLSMYKLHSRHTLTSYFYLCRVTTSSDGKMARSRRLWINVALETHVLVSRLRLLMCRPSAQ